VGEERDDRYVAALQRIVSEHPNEEFAARALARLSDAASAKSDFIRAHQLAEQGARISPLSVGREECVYRLTQLETKTISIRSEAVWNAPWPKLTVQYRNLNKIYFRAVKLDFDAVFAKSRWGSRFSREDAEDALSKKPVLAWSSDLKNSEDYAQHTAEFDAPTTLHPGFYAIVASADPDFRQTDNSISVTSIWVSDLALVVRNEQRGGLGGFVLRASDGSPVAGAKVRTFSYKTDGVPRQGPELTTNADGRFQTTPGNEQIFLVAEKRWATRIKPLRHL
jgi:hypothetical protein